MTDTTITAVAVPETAPDIPQQPPDQKPTPAAEVDHTPGGWPVVPLAVTGTNTTASLLGAAALVGGPAALAIAATGAVVLGTVAAARSRRDQRGKARIGRSAGTRKGRMAGATASGRSLRHGAGWVPKQSRNGSAGTTKATTGHGRSNAAGKTGGSSLLGKSGGLNRGRGLTQARAAGTGSVPAASKARGRATGTGSPSTSKARGRAGQVKALREAQRQASPSRAARRAETTGARRATADARKALKSQARDASLARKGPVGRIAAKAMGKASKTRSGAVDRVRAARDRSTAGKVGQQRAVVRKAPARKRARKALRRSAARFQGRRLLAALLGGVLGVVGMFTTPLGRKLGWAWLMHPGRRLYARLMHAAAEERAGRDEEIRAVQDEQEAAADAEAADDSEQIGDTAERPAGPTPVAPTTASEGEIVSGFRFEEYAAEMESAAQQYDPDNAMEILAMVEGLPAALTSVANVMKILAERADSEFPLEKEVADAFNDIFGAVMSSVAVAEDMGPLFRQAHEKDIARHEDPRNGPEAEKGWNV
ncbi:hypothetical protein AR457_18530 [Streptomyces agglomeratus]|uniref:hypothetical protein n=1 Tax=Streptomyces agglomeratus TaxID=285458 RepID=UPI00085471FE|nr:hypothetical protein [Streptomyces agglomeratus]OEJ45837.1 hypothetical protein AR457_18530 [Streptomyces agglomeratus]